jgi:prepilin-type N-terminal cleavage/methylation domain-containing protein
MLNKNKKGLPSTTFASCGMVARKEKSGNFELSKSHSLIRKSGAGFTLIELLVVISIIGLLSSIVLTTLNDARAKARDAQRISDLGQIRLALQLYYEENGYYPRTQYNDNCGQWGECTSAQGIWNDPQNPLYILVTDGYMPKLPVDPKNTPAGTLMYNDSLGYAYYYSTGDLGEASPTPNDYDLLARMETPGNPSSCGVRDPSGTGICGDGDVWTGWSWVTSGGVANGELLVLDH